MNALTLLVCGAALLSCACQTDEARSISGAGRTILCFGDSLTEGFGVPRGESYPDDLQRELDRHGYRYRVVNMGKSGETTAQGLRRLPLAMAAKPAIVVVEFGANDALQRLPLTNAEANLERMIEAFQKAGTRVVLAGIVLPDFAAGYLPGFNGMYPELAKKYGVPLIPNILKDVLARPEFMQRDGLHPNAAGTRLVAETVFEALKPRLK